MTRRITVRRLAVRPPDIAIDAFLRECHHFDQLMHRLQAIRNDHFGADPKAINWGHSTSVAYINGALHDVLAKITDTSGSAR